MNSDIDFDAPLNDLEKTLSELKAENLKIIDLTISNPTMLGLDYTGLNIPRLLSSKENLFYHPDPKGNIKSRIAIKSYYLNRKNYFLFENESNLFLASGTSECYSLIFKLSSEPGNEVLLPAPGYPLLEHLVKFDRLNPKYYRLDYTKNNWKINFDSVRDAITKKTKFIVIVSPNNPTGHILDKNEFYILDKICNEFGIDIIIDEVFYDYIYNNTSNIFISEPPKNYSIYILNGISKITATPQLKLSWIYMLPQKGSENHLTNKMEFITDAYLSVNTPVQNALPHLLEERQYIQSQIFKRIKNNIIYLKNSGFNIYNSNAGWYACIKLDKNISDDDFCERFLKEEKVLVHPGYFYDFWNDTVIVLSLIIDENIFKNGIDKLKKFLR